MKKESNDEHWTRIQKVKGKVNWLQPDWTRYVDEDEEDEKPAAGMDFEGAQQLYRLRFKCSAAATAAATVLRLSTAGRSRFRRQRSTVTQPGGAVAMALRVTACTTLYNCPLLFQVAAKGSAAARRGWVAAWVGWVAWVACQAWAAAAVWAAWTWRP